MGLLTSLLLLFSLTWFPYSPPAVLKRQERCPSCNQNRAGRGHGRTSRRFRHGEIGPTRWGNVYLKAVSHRMRRNGNNLASTIPCRPSIVPSALSPHTRDQVAIALYKLITPHRRHVLPSWLARERPATRYPRRCMLATKKPTSKQVHAQFSS